MVRANATLMETGRGWLAEMVIDHGWPLRRAAERYGVSVTTARRWSDRYIGGGRAARGVKPIV